MKDITFVIAEYYLCCLSLLVDQASCEREKCVINNLLRKTNGVDCMRDVCLLTARKRLLHKCIVCIGLHRGAMTMCAPNVLPSIGELLSYIYFVK